jgi:hypothetical protein
MAIIKFLALVLPFLVVLTAGNPVPRPRQFLGLSKHLFQGDIKLTPEQKENFQKNGVIGPNYRWPGGLIYYQLDPNFTQTERSAIAASMADISSKSCIRFQERSSQSDYVYIVRGAPGSGCWSYVGRLGGRQELNYEAPGCINARGPGPHELMHAVGFNHEHSRSDRDQYVRILWNNIEPDLISQFNIIEGENFGYPYDYDSIMQYPPWAFSANGQDTIEAYPDPSVPIGPYAYVSAVDGLQVNEMYRGVC